VAQEAATAAGNNPAGGYDEEAQIHDAINNPVWCSISMHNYKLLIGVVFNTNLCQYHAKFFISSKPEGLFHCIDFNSLPSGINPYRSGINPYRSGINTLYRGIPLVTVCISNFGLNFEFER
jgi:hypothetical protein